MGSYRPYIYKAHPAMKAMVLSILLGLAVSITVLVAGNAFAALADIIRSDNYEEVLELVLGCFLFLAFMYCCVMLSVLVLRQRVEIDKEKIISVNAFNTRTIHFSDIEEYSIADGIIVIRPKNKFEKKMVVCTLTLRNNHEFEPQFRLNASSSKESKKRLWLKNR